MTGPSLPPSLPLPIGAFDLAPMPWFTPAGLLADVHRFRLVPEVQDWCDANLAGWSFEFQPVVATPGHKRMAPCMVFANDAEMVLFRLRWA